MLENKTVLTGVKPTGTPHLGNYLGAIKPAVRLGHEAVAAGGKHYMFIADYHAINAEKTRLFSIKSSAKSPVSIWLPDLTPKNPISIVSRTSPKFRKSPLFSMPIPLKGL